MWLIDPFYGWRSTWPDDRIDTLRVADKDGSLLISRFGLVSQKVAAERDAPQEFMVR